MRKLGVFIDKALNYLAVGLTWTVLVFTILGFILLTLATILRQVGLLYE